MKKYNVLMAFMFIVLFLTLRHGRLLSSLAEGHDIVSSTPSTVEGISMWVYTHSHRSYPANPDTFNPHEALTLMLEGENPGLWCTQVSQVWMLLIQAHKLGRPYMVTVDTEQGVHALAVLQKEDRIYVFNAVGLVKEVRDATDYVMGGNIVKPYFLGPPINLSLLRVHPELLSRDGWHNIPKAEVPVVSETCGCKSGFYKVTDDFNVKPHYVNYTSSSQAFKVIKAKNKARNVGVAEKKAVEAEVENLKHSEIVNSYFDSLPLLLMALTVLTGFYGYTAKKKNLVEISILVFLLTLSFTLIKVWEVIRVEGI